MKTDYYAWAARRCAQKEYSRAEMMAKLMEKGAAAPEARDCVDRLEAERYLDDARFAAAFVSDKVRFDHWGRVKIRYALHLKGVADDLTEEALAEIDETLYREQLAQYIAAKRRTVAAPTPYQANQKVARSAISRGYEPALVFEVLKWEEEEE